ncbi:MAG: hypothetical protein AB1641_27355 [Thermodesulfobacteriota bacterium]
MIKKTYPFLLLAALSLLMASAREARAVLPTIGEYQATPPFISAGSPPLVLLVMGRDHKLYYEAYNDASDLDGDGDLDVGFNPDITYYGYFDTNKCYLYNSGNQYFEPTRQTSDGKCGGAGEWSGNFLNYLTMTRMDALRKVLYGGYRYSDTASATILERAYVPRDAHSWGKEYTSVAVDGYNLSDYADYALPLSGRKHFFACSSLYDPSSSSYRPLLRVLPNVPSPSRIWNWVAKERPVVDNSLDDPGSSRYEGYPANSTEFADMISRFANTAHKYTGTNPNPDPLCHDNPPTYMCPNTNGNAPPPGGNIAVYDDPADCPGGYGTCKSDGNPYSGGLATDNDDYYLTVITGTLYIPSGQGGTYTFAVDGDDALEFIVDGVVVASWYNAHSWCNCTSHQGQISLTQGAHTIEFRHQERAGNDSYILYWKGPASTGQDWEVVPPNFFCSTSADLTTNTLRQTTYNVTGLSTKIVDYVVRIKVCDPAMPEANCKQYPNGAYKPIGILQKHGETDTMFFGLITGSYTKNTSGGVLRKNISSIRDEIDANTGQLTSTAGIIKTIDRFRVRGFDYGSYSHNSNCGWIATRAINQGECRLWGNPIAEMMYEGLRYYAGTATPTSDFTYSGTSNDDYLLSLPQPSWLDPYNTTSGFARCSKPFMMVISDITPSFDSDQLPGSAFATFSGTLGTLNVSTLTDEIGTQENITGNYFVGQSETSPSNFNTSCSEKAISGFSKVRGLCPEEPTKQGSYYSAAVSYYGHNNDLHNVAGDQKVTTYAVALASPLPRIEIPIQDKVITLVPFAKSVGGYSINGAEGQFQPTNTIVDFFVDKEMNNPWHRRFRINFEDVEQGADHDMDAITLYEYQLYYKSGGLDVAINSEADMNKAEFVKITLTSEYAAGSIMQHMGYIISGAADASGVSRDGTYLEVRDKDTSDSSDVLYYLDTPPGRWAGDGSARGTTKLSRDTPAVRTFYPKGSGSGPAKLLDNPLFYAAKYGGFIDSNGNNKPDLTDEWDKDHDGLPDTYFYVVNPLKMEEKLNESFASILERTSSGTAASVISGSRTGEGALYQALFYPRLTDGAGNSLWWSGQVYGLFVDHYGNLREDTNQNGVMDLYPSGGVTPDRIVQFYFDTGANETKVKFYTDSDGDGLTEGAALVGQLSDVKTIWDGGKWLAGASAAANRPYDSTNKERRVWTWVDQNSDGMVSDGGLATGSETTASETILFDPESTVDRTILAPYLMARATMTTNLTGASNNLEFTAVQPGLTGGQIRIEYRVPAVNNSPLTITVTGNDVIVNLATNAVGAPFSTAIQVATAVNADVIASALVTASLIEDDKGQGLVMAMSPTQLSLEEGVRKQMRWAVGQDQQNWRKRQLLVDGTAKTWKMGDVIYSTPAVVAAPSEAYDMIYNDSSYFNYRQAFAKRRNVLYIGTNDGVLHAFNAGFWDRTSRSFSKTITASGVTFDPVTKSYIISTSPSEQYNPVAYDLGAELWAFVPQAMLPHLQWLKDKAYPHVYMVDLKPKPTDIRFADGRWRSILICGLRLGGKDISSTDDFNRDGIVQTSPEEKRTFRSEYFALDVTDPEAPPKLLWTFSHPEMGLTTNYPAVVRVKDKWFVVIGSGPRGTQAYDGSSDQNGRVFVLNAETGTMARISPFVVTENTSFMADPAAVDTDLATIEEGGLIKWSSEIVYIGSTSGSPGAWTGVMHRIKTTTSSGAPDEDPNNWTMSTLLQTDGPISSALNATVDASGNLWVYFGTGRFWSVNDKSECLSQCYPDPGVAACTTCRYNSRQWFYGVREPKYESGPNAGQFSFAEVSKTNLEDTSNVTVYENGYVDLTSDGHWDMELSTYITDRVMTKSGWKLKFPDVGERCLYQPVVLGGIVTFSTYVPSADVCDYEGQSYLWALYYMSGTAWSQSVIGTGSQQIPEGGHNVLTRVSLGTGVGTAPSFHIGADSKVMVQSSTGAIISITETTASQVKSGLKAWKEKY